MKKLTNLLVAAFLASATVAMAHDLPYEQDHGIPDDPVPTEDAADLGGGQGVPVPHPAGDLGGEPSFLLTIKWGSILIGFIALLPNRSQVLP